jgi:alkyl sulfatase BDS1-like metallo-beta-lactamase superfamily hydrolase
MATPDDTIPVSDVIASRPAGSDITPATDGPAVEVAPDVWRSDGLSNAYLVATPAGRVVINTGMGFEGPAHRRRFDEVSDAPIAKLIFTQGHVDHVGGADRFIEDDTEVIAQSANAACQADDARIHAFRVRRSAPFWADAIAAADSFIRSSGDGEFPPQSAPIPTLTFDDNLEFELGGTRFELLSVPGGETVDSLVVWLPDRRIAIAGNLFSALVGHIPNLMTVRGDRLRDPVAFIDSVQRVIDLEPELLLTGHFGPIEGAAVIRAELERIRDATGYVLGETVAAMNRGDDVWSAMRSIELPEDLRVGQGYGKVSWDVRAIWELYGGWFHHRSTTELTGADPNAAAAEIVALAGGVDPVVARAGEVIDKGDVEIAIQLLETALAVDGSTAETWRQWKRAHEALLDADDSNFWQVGWLRQQIARADRRVSKIEGQT